MLNEAILAFIEEHRQEAYDLLLTLARIPAPSNHEEKRARFCCEWLKAQGAKGVYVDEALNVVYPVEAEGFGSPNAIAVLSGVINSLYALKVPGEGGRTTYNVGLISGGTSVNTIAQQAGMLFEIRSESSENLEYMEEQFFSVLHESKAEGIEVYWKVIGLRPCGGAVDPAALNALAERAARVVAGVTGTEPRRCSGSTDCNIPFSLGIPSVCVGSFRGGEPIQGRNMWK